MSERERAQQAEQFDADGQFFVCAFLATDPPARRLIAAQLEE